MTHGDVVPCWSGEIARGEVTELLSVLERVAKVGIVSVLPGEIGFVAVSELCCSPI